MGNEVRCAKREIWTRIKNYVAAITELEEGGEVQQIRSQLRVIGKSIRQLERGGIHVPDGLKADRLDLESKMDEVKKGP